MHPSAVGSLPHWRSAIRSDLRVIELADFWQTRLSIPVVAVVDDGLQVLGLIERENLFSMLGKPYGRDILQRNLALDVMQAVDCVDYRTNVFAVARDRDLEALPDSVSAVEEQQNSPSVATDHAYIAMVDEQQQFRGLVSYHQISDYLATISRNDVEMAARLQSRMVEASALDQHCGCSIEAFALAAMGVGGDFYYYRSLPGRKLFAALCDVSGKGLAASLIVALVWGSLKAFDFSRGLKELLVLLNSAIVNTFQLEKYLTGIFFVYEAEAKRLVCADMGHAHFAIVRNQACLPVRSPRNNLPIGLDPELKPSLYGLDVFPGDIVIAYSDGIVEQTNPSGEEFGEKRLWLLLKKYAKERSHDLKDLVSRELQLFCGSTPQHDDMSMLVLRIE